MTNRRSNRALSSTRRWTAGILLASTLVTGGVGIHLAEAYAAQSGTVTASTSSTGSSASNSSSSFGSTGAVSGSSNAASTTTSGS